MGRAPLRAGDGLRRRSGAGACAPDVSRRWRPTTRPAHCTRAMCRPRHEQRCRFGREQDRMREHVHVGAKQVQEGRHVRIDALCKLTTRTIARAHA